MASLASILLGYRYVLFVLFVIFNAVIASVAAWDYGMAHETGHNQQIDTYLIFLGILGVIYIIFIAAVDILRKNAVPSRVWFECLWVGVFWVLELAGASAVTANASNSVCSLSGITNACVPINVLIAFGWLCTVILMVYLLALSVSAILNQGEGINVWQSSVRFFPWYATKSSLNSAPPSPSRQWQKPLQLAGPRPHRPTRRATLTQSFDRDLERGIPAAAPRAEQPSEATRAAPPAPEMQQMAREQPSLYPAVLKSHLPSKPTRSDSAPLPPPAAPRVEDWVRSQHHGRSQTQDSVATGFRPIDNAPAVSPSQATPVARHPRRGSNGSPSRERRIPPPLDLTRISAYKAVDDRLARR